MRLILTASLFFLCMSVWAISQEDFAYGYSLEVDGDGAIYSLYLNEDIYKGITQSDRADLRIFNSQGIAVPHYIRRNEQYTRKRETVENAEPPFFPLYKESSYRDKAKRIRKKQIV